jgi:ribosomal protein S26
MGEVKGRARKRIGDFWKIKYIDCQYCGVANPLENENCSECGATLPRKKADAMIA